MVSLGKQGGEGEGTGKGLVDGLTKLAKGSDKARRGGRGGERCEGRKYKRRKQRRQRLPSHLVQSSLANQSDLSSSDGASARVLSPSCSQIPSRLLISRPDHFVHNAVASNVQ